jgi:hypothetical protein
VVYTAVATDPEGTDVTYTLGGADADAFTIDPVTGELTIVDSPDFEGQNEFVVEITATDEEGSATTQTVTISITDINEAPTFTSDATGDVDENVAAGSVVTTATVTDPEGDDVTFSLTGPDADAFEIDPDTGEVTIVGSPDFETQDEYNFTIVATDSDGNETEQDFTLSVNDLDETPEVSLDQDDDGNVATPFTIDADGDDFLFIEDADVANNVVVSNFGAGDQISLEGVSNYNFTNIGNGDLRIDFNNNGTASQIVLEGALDANPNAFITDAASAEAAAGFDFIVDAPVDQNFA